MKPSKANDKQVGGNHYRLPTQHWDWAQHLPYLEGNATKYIGRHGSSKGKGVEDLRKALHYIQNIVERDYPDYQLDWVLDEPAMEEITYPDCGPTSAYVNQD